MFGDRHYNVQMYIDVCSNSVGIASLVWLSVFFFSQTRTSFDFPVSTQYFEYQLLSLLNFNRLVNLGLENKNSVKLE